MQHNAVHIMQEKNHIQANFYQNGSIDSNDVYGNMYGSEAKWFGGSVAKANNNGKGSFSELGLQGVPVSGPHHLYFE